MTYHSGVAADKFVSLILWHCATPAGTTSFWRHLMRQSLPE